MTLYLVVVVVVAVIAMMCTCDGIKLLTAPKVFKFLSEVVTPTSMQYSTIH